VVRQFLEIRVPRRWVNVVGGGELTAGDEGDEYAVNRELPVFTLLHLLWFAEIKQK
jgi:hypothetical protein